MSSSAGFGVPLGKSVPRGSLALRHHFTLSLTKMPSGLNCTKTTADPSEHPTPYFLVIVPCLVVKRPEAIAIS